MAFAQGGDPQVAERAPARVWGAAAVPPPISQQLQRGMGRPAVEQEVSELGSGDDGEGAAADRNMKSDPAPDLKQSASKTMHLDGSADHEPSKSPGAEAEDVRARGALEETGRKERRAETGAAGHDTARRGREERPERFSAAGRRSAADIIDEFPAQDRGGRQFEKIDDFPEEATRGRGGATLQGGRSPQRSQMCAPSQSQASQAQSGGIKALFGAVGAKVAAQSQPRKSGKGANSKRKRDADSRAQTQVSRRTGAARAPERVEDDDAPPAAPERSQRAPGGAAARFRDATTPNTRPKKSDARARDAGGRGAAVQGGDDIADFSDEGPSAPLPPTPLPPTPLKSVSAGADDSMQEGGGSAKGGGFLKGLNASAAKSAQWEDCTM